MQFASLLTGPDQPESACLARLALVLSPASAQHRLQHENRPCWIPVHRGGARPRRGAWRRRAAMRWQPRSRCSADSSRIFSAIPNGRCRRTPDLVVSPADGRVMIAGPSDGRWAPPGDWKQITIFLSPMDVHMNRVAGCRAGSRTSTTGPESSSRPTTKARTTTS